MTTLKSGILSNIYVVTQLKWIRPALMTLAVLASVLSLTGFGHRH